MTAGIYTIRNLEDGRVYVGSSINVPRRLGEHRGALNHGRHSNAKLQRAWQADGAAAFELTVVETVLDVTILEAREQCWIDLLGAARRDTGYNLAPVAGSPRGCSRSAETRARMSVAARERIRAPLSPEGLANLAAANRRKPPHPQSAEARAKISAAKRGVRLGPQSAERRAKTSAALTGKKRTPEMNAAQSARRKGVPLGPLSAEAKARMSVAQKESWKRRKAKLAAAS
ncbi:MAG: GIY-YIG nuclease family protein [Gemmatimonadales bacterium]